MAYFQLGGQELTLKAGPQRIGPDAGAELRLPSGDATCVATVTVSPDQTVVIQRAGDAAIVKVNGVALGAEPSPLFHGDRVEIGGHELRFGDDKQAGSTQFVSSSAIADAIRARASGPAKPTTATGGRLVSLVDGREYAVPNTGLTIGRDPTAEVVIAATEVSRKHVTIAPAGQGYLLTDLSTNGVWVNGNRVAQQQVLGRGDVLKVGSEEFRFYADVVKAAPGVGVPAVPSGPSAAVPPSPPAAMPRPMTPAGGAPTTGAMPGLAPSLAPTLAPSRVPPSPAAPPAHAPPKAPTAPAPPAIAPPAAAQPAVAPARPSAPRPTPPPSPPPPAPAPPPPPPAPPAPQPPPAPRAAPPTGAPPAPPAPAPALASPPGAAPSPARPSISRPALAVLEVINEGPDKGKTFEVRGPLTNIGRGEHNDLALTNESVSDSHAKLQKRESGWFIVDIDSTNGTYVGGRRVKGEQQLAGSPDLRFGDVKVVFRPSGAVADTDKGTRAIAGVSVEEAKRVAARKSAMAAPAPAPVKPDSTESKGGVPAWIWIVVVLVAGAAAAYFFLLKT